MDLHAGRLTAFSAGMGKGAEFRCELPCVLLGSEKRTKDVFVDEPRSSKKTLHLAASYDKSSTTPSVATRRQGSTAPVTRTYSGTTAAASNSSGAGNFSGCNSPLLTSVNGTADAIRRVMVVDDSSTSRMVMVRLLRNAGYECTEAVDGLDCIEKIQGHAASGVPVDLVLMDFEMPRMNGPEATRKIRESGYVIPIVGVTGNVLPADKCFFMAHGANTVLHKPLSIDQLQLELARLNRRSASPVLSQHTNCVEDCFKNYFSGENLV